MLVNIEEVSSFPLHKQFGMYVRFTRERRKKSMLDVAKLFNESVVYVSDMELGNRNPPNKKRIQKLANFLDIDENFLLELAIRTNRKITLDFEIDTPKQKLAIMLDEYWESLSDSQILQISQILENH